MATIRLAARLQTDSVVDGSGLRLVVWCQGCPHHCEGCHNPDSHDFLGGTVFMCDDIIHEIAENKYHDGITFSGGEPMNQVESCIVIAKAAKQENLNVWCYTGYTWEDLQKMQSHEISEFIALIDVLVDGKFDNNLKSLNIPFRGSSNQRCIDVKKTLENKEIVTIN